MSRGKEKSHEETRKQKRPTVNAIRIAALIHFPLINILEEKPKKTKTGHINGIRWTRPDKGVSFVSVIHLRRGSCPPDDDETSAAAAAVSVLFLFLPFDSIPSTVAIISPWLVVRRRECRLAWGSSKERVYLAYLSMRWSSKTERKTKSSKHWKRE